MSVGFSENFEMPLPKKRAPEKKEAKRPEDFWAEVRKKNSLDYGYHWHPEARKSYLKQGAEFVVDIHEKKPDTIVFLDKSARPLAGFFRAIWRRLYQDETPPEMRFMNIGRRDPPTAETIAKAFAASKDSFDGKSVLVVDELVSTGNTLSTAQSLLRKAFPNARKIMSGGVTGSWSSTVDINPTSYTLGFALYKQSDSEIKEVPYEAITKAAREIPASRTTSYRLRQVGKHEMLDASSLRGQDERKDENPARLERIRAAYEKLMSKE